MPDQTDNQDSRNDEIVAALLAQLQPLVDRLTPEIEPAPVYIAAEHSAE